MRTFTTRHIALAALALAALSCSKSSTPTTPTPGNTPQVQTNTITITAAGANPRNVSVAVGSRVLFINNDTRTHNMVSDPHPDHMDCPDLNQVGFLAPGQSRETGNLVTARTCGFHDHDLPAQATLTGQIVIR
jgi:plastocyanin